MRLYLSSYRMGDHPEHLVALAGEAGRRAVVIANAMDPAPAGVRRDAVEYELAGLGFDAVELDLRDYFGHRQRLREDLGGADVAWLRGGNTFMLRHALRYSGGDVVFTDLLAADALVYAGYSAGACVLAPSLRGLELVDDAAWSRGPTARNRSGTGSDCLTRRSCRTTGCRGTPRPRRWTWWWRGTGPRASRTGRCATGRPWSSTGLTPWWCSTRPGARRPYRSAQNKSGITAGGWVTAGGWSGPPRSRYADLSRAGLSRSSLTGRTSGSGRPP